MTIQTAHAQGGSEARIEALEPLRSGLHLLALRTLGDVDAAEEAVQETLARAVAALARGQLADPAKLPAFVAGIARHVVVDMMRARRRLASLDALPPTAHPRHAPDVLGPLVAAGRQARVGPVLSGLAPAGR